jgi:hypothetical protein
MKSIYTIVFFMMFYMAGHCQEKEANIEKGTVYILSKPKGGSYKHIYFPRKNQIIKRGAIADFNSLIGTKLIISESISPKKNTKGNRLIREDGKPFFRFFNSVYSNIELAVNSGELKVFSE